MYTLSKDSKSLFYIEYSFSMAKSNQEETTLKNKNKLTLCVYCVKERVTEKQVDREKEKQVDRETEKQRDRETEKQRDK